MKTVFILQPIIRSEIESMKDTMAWVLQAGDFILIVLMLVLVFRCS